MSHFQTLLIVDDDENSLKGLARYLENDYDVLTARSAAEAITIFKREKPDLVLSVLEAHIVNAIAEHLKPSRRHRFYKLFFRTARNRPE